MTSSEHRWNARGEGYVAAQVLVLAGILVLPLLRPRQGTPRGLRVAGTALILAGGTLTGWSGLRLGPNLTPLPEPQVDGQLVQTGPYTLVRHPIYSGLLLASLGWALAHGHRGALGLSGGLAFLFDLKALDEERRLTRHFPEYPAYRQRVRRFLPGVY
ncbi:methyltransferase family protein [Deinococcus arcticus]|uniref:Isoprenylcysteine carboxylmethyltransferase family protein n=1 Tax=Deinococcus arcticus TaxID=2136176 RepID=A0A2T3W4D9_9DEIO|nr:isoprenylcysteine carboxylmethyltransferase family protein [Deinococcus arcticus]PTA66747.1 isoprenylcysteine carboxylmethyltransferase family protein [Deinococcus arcticus]